MFPTPYTVQRLPYVEGATDAHGNPVESWGAPEDVAVYGWAAPNSTEPKLAGHDRVVVDVEVYAPTSFAGPRDKVTLPAGKTYRVEGEPEDYNHGPFGWQPGYVVNLSRVEG